MFIFAAHLRECEYDERKHKNTSVIRGLISVGVSKGLGRRTSFDEGFDLMGGVTRFSSIITTSGELLLLRSLSISAFWKNLYQIYRTYECNKK